MFSRANPFDESVSKFFFFLFQVSKMLLLNIILYTIVAATNENLTVENWELILAVTDKINRASPER
jgi:hypothetical protein